MSKIRNWSPCETAGRDPDKVKSWKHDQYNLRVHVMDSFSKPDGYDVIMEDRENGGLDRIGGPYNNQKDALESASTWLRNHPVAATP